MTADAVAELIQAREEVLKAALNLLMAERNLSDEGDSTKALMDAESALDAAASWLARARTARTLAVAAAAVEEQQRTNGWSGGWAD